MQPYQIKLLYLYYGRRKSLQLIAQYCVKMEMSVFDICRELLLANREFTRIRAEINKKKMEQLY